MKRNEFIKNCGLFCLGTFTIIPILNSCSSTKMISGFIENDNLIVNESEFVILKNTQEKPELSYHKYIIVQNNQLQYPICVFRNNEQQYNALLMRCTHQGNELIVYGDKLQCAAHGSEFDKSGIATNGPAEKALKSFPITIENQKIKISLKKA